MAPDLSILQRNAKLLEDRFFLEQDKVLVEKMRELKKMEETRHALTAVSGITNTAVLDKLIALDIRPDVLASMAVVPLIQVAWADGSVEAKERAAIMEAASQGGLAKGSPDFQLLERWLNHKPGPELLDAWTHYIEGLAELMTHDERVALRASLVDRARKVAEAAGGFLGLTSPVSDGERRMLERLEQAFGNL
jgi:chloramphenicol 3-O-phosphotransferase